MHSGAKKFFKNFFFNFKVTFASLGPGLTLKRPQGPQSRTFTGSKVLNLYGAQTIMNFAEIMEKLSKSIRSCGPRKGPFSEN